MSSTQIELQHSSSMARRASSGASTSPPSYNEGGAVELHSLSKDSSVSLISLPPRYGSVVSSAPNFEISSPVGQQPWQPTRCFQIETLGHPLFALPLPPRPDAIPVYEVTPSGAIDKIAYESLRATRQSGNCVLVHGGDDKSRALCSTTYRFGPGRPPRIQLHGVGTGINGADEEFMLESSGCHTRTQTLRTHLGTFQWRYASRKERREADANSLIFLEQITTVALAGGKTEQQRRRIAQLVRNEQYRTKGAKSSTAGNGGRLMMDLRNWSIHNEEQAQLEVLVIASALAMLKKEIDRRRLLQFVVIMSALSGGS